MNVDDATRSWSQWVAEAGPDSVILRPSNVAFPLRRAGRRMRLLVGPRGIFLRGGSGPARLVLPASEVAVIRHSYAQDLKEIGLRDPGL